MKTYLSRSKHKIIILKNLEKMEKILASIGMLLTYTAAISAANTPRWADNDTKTAPIEVTDTMAYDSIKWSENLDAVTVVAKKPLVKSELDKMTYDVESDPEAQANSVLEMLRKVPMVTVDGQDNIMVNNSSSFKVYVNGKPNNMMSNNPSEVLKNMPANSVKKIEVITNPGPKYDAEGVGGIINIITTGKGMEGYSLTVGTNYNTQGRIGANMFGTVQSGKLTVSGRYSYTHSDAKRYWGGNRREVTGNIDETSANVESYSTSNGWYNYHSGSFEASYEIDSLRLVSASFGLWAGGGHTPNERQVVATSPLDESPLYHYSNFDRSRNSWSSIDGGIDYQRSFPVKDRLLTLSYKINSNPSDDEDEYVYHDIDGVEAWQDYLHMLKDQRHEQDGNSLEQTFQIDYTTPFAKIHTLEAGLKYIMRDNHSNDDRYIREALSAADYAYDEANSSHYKHTNDIFAGYMGYGVKWKLLSGRLGLRYEHTLQDVKYRLGRGEDFRKNFDDLVPSASFGVRVSDYVNFSLAYNMRIFRPGIWYLNPYLDDSNPASLSQGNSDLVSEKKHQITLGFNLNTSKLSLNVKAATAFVNNSIEGVTSLVDDRTIAGLSHPTGKQVIYTTYENIGKMKGSALSAYVSWNIFSKTRIYSNLYGLYSDYSNGQTMRNHGWFGYTFTGIEQTLPKDWFISLDYFGRTKSVSLQGKGSSYSDYGITVKKSFLNKRLNVSVYAGSLFNKYTRQDDVTESTNFRQSSWSKTSSRRFYFSVTYRFGSLKASVKKAERGIENDDVKGGGGSKE